MNPEELKNRILNSSKPIIIKNRLKWEILDWSLDKWKDTLKDEEMEFRVGKFESTKAPQWERNTKTIKGKFDKFLKEIEKETNTWLYFDYKYLNQVLLSATNLRNDITWDALGFPEVTIDENTIWIGSKGAHTPCHIDTYGCNLVCQVYGRKLWVLFPPEENLKATRVPYEESSIYSELNFFSPTVDDFLGLSNPYICILDPGDVLYVPHKWWHYVENLETAITVNIWLPSPEDDSERLKEALIQFLIKQVTDLTDSNIKKEILNPNMEEIFNQDPKNIFEMIAIMMHRNNLSGVIERVKTETLEYNDCIKEVLKATDDEWKSFLSNQSKRFTGTLNAKNFNLDKMETMEIKLVKALSDPEVISLIYSKFRK